MPDNPQVGDLVRGAQGNGCLGIVIVQRPKEVVGASWVPERYVVWWISLDKKTTEFYGSPCDQIKVVSFAEKGVVEKRN